MFSQSDCIFAMLIMHAESLQKLCFSGSVTDMHQKTCLDPLRASIWEPFGQPKSIRNRSGGHLERHRISDLAFEAMDHAREVSCTLEPRPPSPIVYILQTRARFARAQFSRTSIWRPRPSLGGTGSAPRTWTPLLVYLRGGTIYGNSTWEE